MKICVIAWARNEADILEAWVRHHAEFADEIHLVLHRTRDNSEEILTQLQREGHPITWEKDERFTHEQQAVLTQLLHEKISDGYDWVFPLDLDEFVMGDVKKELAGLQGKLIRLPWKGYVPTPHDDQKERHVLKRVQYRRKEESPQWFKVCTPASLMLANKENTLGRGNHCLQNTEGATYPTHECGLWIAHFPVRSIAQLKRKVLCGWLADKANGGHEDGASFHWKKLNTVLKIQNNLTLKMLQDIAMDYATEIPQPNELILDPVPCDHVLQYNIIEADTETVIRENDEVMQKASCVM